MERIKLKSVNPEVEDAINDFMAGRINTRQAGRILGVSHQQVLNMVAALFRKGYQDGKIKIEGEL